MTSALGEDVAASEVGPQFSAPTLREMFGHVYNADLYWLRNFQQWTDQPQSALPWAAAHDVRTGAVIQTLGDLRSPWGALENDQRRVLDGVAEGDLLRLIELKSRDGKTRPRPMRPTIGARSQPC